MTTITTRAGKGSALTHNEMDTNFTNLNTAKLETFTLAGNVSGSLASNVLTINLNSTQTNITSVGTLTGLTLSGTLTGTTVQAATIGNSGATLTGTLSTAAQTNITFTIQNNAADRRLCQPTALFESQTDYARSS